MTIAFVVTRFVCPAVTLPTHARKITNGTISLTACRELVDWGKWSDCEHT